MSAPTVTPELRALLRRVKLGRCLDTLPERLALAHTGGMGHAEFLEPSSPTRSPDESTQRDASPDRRLDPTMTLDRWDDDARSLRPSDLERTVRPALRHGGHDAVIMGPVGVGKTLWPPPLATSPAAVATTTLAGRCDQILKRLHGSPVSTAATTSSCAN